MKKLVLSFIAMMLMTVSFSSHAGAVKNLLIDAEDAIYAKYFDNAYDVFRITNHKLVTVDGLVGVEATVRPLYVVKGQPSSWSCLVLFKQVAERSFNVSSVECN